MQATSNLSPNELRKHIFILSTFLDGKQSSPSTHHPDDRTLDVYSDISTLLTIGNDKQPRAQNVNAVMGNVSMGSAATSVEFIVCAENTAIRPKIESREPPEAPPPGQVSKLNKRPKKGSRTTPEVRQPAQTSNLPNRPMNASSKPPPASQASQASTLPTPPKEIIVEQNDYAKSVSLFPAMHRKRILGYGHKLLQQWDGTTLDRSEVMQENNYPFTMHLRHLFHVITSLNYDDPSDLPRFQRFIHHRAYRKLGYRVRDFSQRWGISPMTIIIQNLDPSVESPDIHFPQDPEFHSFVARFAPPTSTSPQPTYHIRPATAHKWAEMLQVVWIRLQLHVLNIEIDGTLMETKDVEFIQKLDTTKQQVAYWVKEESPSNGRVVAIVLLLDILTNLLMPVLGHLISSEKVSRALHAAERAHYKMISESIQNSEYTDAEDPDLDISIFDDSSKFHGDPADRLLQGMRTIVAWQTSCRNIFREGRRFQDNNIVLHLSEFHYKDDALPTISVDSRDIASVLRLWQGTTPDADTVSKIMRRMKTAKVHAEAALMQWIDTVYDAELMKEWPIGVSKKCCWLCWMLHHAYNEKRTCKFILPGTHGIFFAWIPPPGLPVDILISLRNVLVEACKHVVVSHSRQSSASSIKSVKPAPHDPAALDFYQDLKAGR